MQDETDRVARIQRERDEAERAVAVRVRTETNEVCAGNLSFGNLA